MAHITTLPLELLERILYMLDPLDVSVVAQSGHFFRELVYGAKQCQRFWRGLYLSQPLDDPRSTVTHLGNPRWKTGQAGSRYDLTTTTMESTTIHTEVDIVLDSVTEPNDIDWRSELQRIIRARTVVRNHHACRQGEWREVLETLLHLATTLPPVPFSESECTSRNIKWLLKLLRDGDFFDIDKGMDEGYYQDGCGRHQEMEQDGGEMDPNWTRQLNQPLTPEESQMLAQLHTLVGLTRQDLTQPQKRIASRAFVYDLRNCSEANAYGPFMPDGSMYVDWKYMQALEHVYMMLWIEMEREEDTKECGGVEVDMDDNRWGTPSNLLLCQSFIPPGMNLDTETDWAGVEGLCSPPPLDTSIFEGDEVQEMHSSVTFYFRVTDIEHDPDHPTRPKISYAGELDGHFSVLGWVRLTPDDQVWWHFGGGNRDQPVWNGEGIGLGGVRSQAGILGVWSTVFHDREDPVGPFWMRRQQFIVD
ncbi:hypothetical protein ID866_10061 [Astraeus odoratus]|nr:hypothetical protein ID866_10061 [Astraeus odoratus]